MAGPARVVVLGLDAASPRLLRRWAADGTLPVLASLMDRGLVAPLIGLDGFFVGSTWPSLYTGVSPARHGVHYLAQIPPGDTAYRAVADGAYVKHEPFWERLSAAGRRVAILDVPLSRPTRGLDGIQTVEWGGHDRVFGFRTWPESLAGEIRGRYGDHPLPGSCDGVRRSASAWTRLVDQLVAGAETKGRLTVDLLGRGDWDLLVQVFTEAHCAGHQCWHLHDPAHPGHDSAVAARVGDPLLRVYTAIDSAVGKVVECADGACVLVVAGHGMSYAYGAQFLLRDILIRLGVTAPAPDDSRAEGGLTAALRAAARRLPSPARRPLAALRARVRPHGGPGLPHLGVDPAASACFPVANGLAVGGIRLNLVGREQTGMLAPGDANDFTEQLIEDLLAVVDERTGEPAVRRVLRTATLYRGEYLGDLPDILVEWSDAVPTGSAETGTGAGAHVRLSSARIGVVEGVNTWPRTGSIAATDSSSPLGPMSSPGDSRRASGSSTSRRLSPGSSASTSSTATELPSSG